MDVVFSYSHNFTCDTYLVGDFCDGDLPLFCLYGGTYYDDIAIVDFRCHAVAVDMQGETVWEKAVNPLTLDKFGYLVMLLSGDPNDVCLIIIAVIEHCTRLQVDNDCAIDGAKDFFSEVFFNQGIQFSDRLI